MGGYNSGFKGIRKLTTSEVLCLDVKKIGIKRNDMFKCTLEWSNGSRIGVIKKEQYNIVIGYAIANVNSNKEYYKYDISIDYTPCTYGNERSWFICPRCGRRCSKLYFRENYFRCRTCQSLNYRLQQEDKNDRLIESINIKIYKLQDRLKMKRDLNSYNCIKPKGMHYRTYIGLEDNLKYYLNKKEETIHKVMYSFNKDSLLKD